MMIEGLRTEMKEKLISQHFTEFSKAVKECRYIEKRMSSLAAKDSNKGAFGSGGSSEKWKNQGGPPRGDNKRPTQAGGRGGQGSSGSRTCWYCRKPFHPGKI